MTTQGAGVSGVVGCTAETTSVLSERPGSVSVSALTGVALKGIRRWVPFLLIFVVSCGVSWLQVPVSQCWRIEQRTDVWRLSNCTQDWWLHCQWYEAPSYEAAAEAAKAWNLPLCRRQ